VRGGGWASVNLYEQVPSRQQQELAGIACDVKAPSIPEIFRFAFNAAHARQNQADQGREIIRLFSTTSGL